MSARVVIYGWSALEAHPHWLLVDFSAEGVSRYSSSFSSSTLGVVGEILLSNNKIRVLILIFITKNTRVTFYKVDMPMYTQIYKLRCPCKNDFTMKYYTFKPV